MGCSNLPPPAALEIECSNLPPSPFLFFLIHIKILYVKTNLLKEFKILPILREVSRALMKNTKAFPVTEVLL